jgi:hypothetical protein
VDKKVVDRLRASFAKRAKARNLATPFLQRICRPRHILKCKPIKELYFEGAQIFQTNLFMLEQQAPKNWAL